MTTLMAARDGHERWSLDVLSTELIVLVLRQLWEGDSRSLGVVRLVSKRLNDAVVPIQYHTKRLTQRIIAPDAAVDFPEGVAHICAHTRHVRVDSELNVEHIKTLLEKMERLSSISWRFQQDSLHQGEIWVPSGIIPRQRTHDVKLYVENVPLQDFRCERNNFYLRSMPPGTLVSLKMAAPIPPFTARVESLKGLLLNSPRLETFWYEERGQGTQFSFKPSERFPPLKELSLRSYDWNHDADAVRRHWHFSEIRRLELIDVPLNPFLSSVSFTDFQNLESLCLDDFSMHRPDTRQEATDGQYALIKQIRALAELKITCHTQSFPLDGILQHARSLRALRFRDYVGFADEDVRCPTLSIEDLDMMSRQLVNVRTLEIDMDGKLVETNSYIRTLCNFRQLSTLVLHTQTVVDPFHVDANRDRDKERAKEMISSLVRDKQGVSWRAITINVGGWKQIMVRRLAPPWRRLNGRGVYAERCFVMDRGEDGEVAVREELPVSTL
ncbi:hypothetical protein GGR50DRAFT_472550 [Xylaria sp. CBS 124048]|nr:hypothetical protein GGR50DRAFT_472550 [Xylaria sp. CBS 124048]